MRAPAAEGKKGVEERTDVPGGGPLDPLVAADYGAVMSTEIRKFGEESGVVLDAELLERAGLKPGDAVEAELTPDGRILIGTSGQAIDPQAAAAAARRLISKNDELFRRLS